MKRLVLLLVGFAVSSVSFAAETSSARLIEDKKAPTYNEIERGFHIGLTAGAFFMINAPTGAPTGDILTHGCSADTLDARSRRARPLSAGQSAQVEMGYDIGARVSVALSLTSTRNGASADFLGFSKCNDPVAGDFSALIPGLSVRVNLIGFNDSQEVKRTWLYVKAGGGYAIMSPSAMFNSGDVFLHAGVGVLYFTKLRHFSIGLEVTGNFLALTGTIGFAITPSLRYAF